MIVRPRVVWFFVFFNFNFFLRIFFVRAGFRKLGGRSLGFFFLDFGVWLVVFGVALMVFKAVEALVALVVKVSVEASFPSAGFGA